MYSVYIYSEQSVQLDLGNGFILYKECENREEAEKVFEEIKEKEMIGNDDWKLVMDEATDEGHITHKVFPNS